MGFVEVSRRAKRRPHQIRSVFAPFFARLRLGVAVGVGALSALLTGAYPIAARAQEDLATIEKAARQEGPMIWYVSFYGADIAEKTAAAFAKKYDGLVVKVVRATTGGIFLRLCQDLRANKTVASVVTMSGIGDHYGLLVRDKVLATYLPRNADAIIETARLTIVPGLVYPMGGGLMAIAYNI